MISNTQFREVIIRPTLKAISLYSLNAEEILVATAAQESLGATYLVQMGMDWEKEKGGLGLFQMERATYQYVVSLYCPEDDKQRKTGQFYIKQSTVMKICNFADPPHASEMITNLRYATIMARLNYLRCPGALPDANDIEAIWIYYKKYWNSTLGSATKKQFLKNYYLFTGRKP